MELWIRSTARTNLTKCDCLSVIEGKEIYEEDNWEYDGYVICQCYGSNPTKNVTPLGTYKTKERALEVLDEIQSIISPKINIVSHKISEKRIKDFSRDVLIEPIINDIQLKETSTYVYEMPKE